MGYSHQIPERKVVEQILRTGSSREKSSMDIRRIAHCTLHGGTLLMSYLSETARIIRDNLQPDASPPENSDSLFLLYAVLLRSKGEAVTAADVHDAWAAWMESRRPNHPAIVPFDKLPASVQETDLSYVRAIHAAARVQAAAGDS